MRLRTQLGLFFTVMAGITLALGALTVWGGGQLLSTFSQSLKEMESLSQVRSLQVLLARQKASLDAYFLLGDTQELDRFGELSRLVNTRLSEMQAAGSSGALVQTLGKRYEQVTASAQEVITLYETDKTKAFNKATESLLPRVKLF